MRFTKKIDTKQSGGAVAVSEPPPGDAIGIAEAEVAGLTAQQQEVDAELAGLHAETVACGRRIASGEPGAEVEGAAILARVNVAKMKASGIAAAHAEATAKLDALYAQRRVAAVRAEGEQHLVEFADAATRLTDAEQQAERAWWSLAEGLFAMQRATEELNAERFRPQRGADLAGAAWQKLRNQRLVAYTSGRPMLIGTVSEVCAVGPLPAQRL